MLSPFNHISPKHLTRLFYYLMCAKTVQSVAKSVDPDQTSRSVASDRGLHCLLRHASPHN